MKKKKAELNCIHHCFYAEGTHIHKEVNKCLPGVLISNREFIDLKQKLFYTCHSLGIKSFIFRNAAE